MARCVASLFCFLLLLGIGPLNAQVAEPDPTGWINYRQRYYKLPVAETGLYRVSVADLQRAGVPVETINPVMLQLFHRGTEQAIFVAGEADGHLDPGDYIEFYGRGNDGASDSLLYKPHRAQPHPFYSLFSDTTAYFLTWQLDNRPGKRMRSYADTLYAGLTPEPYHWAEERQLFTDDYPGWPAGLLQKVEYSYYEAGEGYTSRIQQRGQPFELVFQLANPDRTGPGPELDVLLVGRSGGRHQVVCSVGSTDTARQRLDSARFAGFENVSIRHTIPWSAIGPDGRLVVSLISGSEEGLPDDYSVSYSHIRYPQLFTANNQPATWFGLRPNPTGQSLLEIGEVLPNTQFYDVSEPASPVRIESAMRSGGVVRLVVHDTGVARLVLATNQPKSVPAILPVSFTNWTARQLTYLIISHESLMKPAPGTANAVREYAAYRASEAGGGHDTLTVSMQQVIDQFNYGERSPLAITQFVRQLYRQGINKLQNLLLIGRGRSTPGIRQNPLQSILDLVMTAGFPGSDGLFTTGFNTAEPDVPAVPTGRINASTPQDVMDYLNKVKAYEKPDNQGLWRKNLLHLSGGRTAQELLLFRQLVDKYQERVVTPALGARVNTLSKKTANLVELVDASGPVNEGVGLITFFGHSGLDVTDLDIGFCSNDALGYRNEGRYPVLLINGCAIGNFFFGRPTLATDWVLSPNRGAIAALAQSHLGYADVMDSYSTAFYRLLTDSTQLHKSIGQLQQETIRQILTTTTDGRALANAQQMVLQGDPAIRPFPFTTPDYILTAGGLTVQGINGHPLTTLSDSVTVRVVVQNAGQYRRGPLPVRVRRWANGQETGLYNLTLKNAVAYSDTLTITLPNSREASGENQFEVTINPADRPDAQPEINHKNNAALTTLTLAGQTPVLVYPPDGGYVNTATVRLTAQYLADGLHLFDLEIDSTDRFTSPFRQAVRLTAGPAISYPTQLINQLNVTYFWRVRLANSPAAPWVTGTFTYQLAPATGGLPEGQIELDSAWPGDVRQGDELALPIRFTNLSPVAFTDSLLVRQTIYGAGLTNPQTTEWRVRAIAGMDTLRFTTRISTEKLPDLNRVVVTVNPRRQPEYSFINNTLDFPLYVQPDRFGPLLDVAIDGAHISDGAVVSARPVLDVVVADENRSLIRRDTTGLALWIQRPGVAASFEKLNWNKATAQPAGPDNVYRVRYPFSSLSDGIYQLLVTAQDVLGNVAVPYRVSFRVVNARELTLFTVYPNPFQEQTLFSFTLTGHEAPDAAVLTVTDLTGRVLRQMNLTPRIGRNEWVWDGRSDAGALLPAGEYMYKLDLSGASDWAISPSLTGHLSGRIILHR